MLLRFAHLGSGIPVIIFTGFDRAGMREKCLEAEASVYLFKPIESAERASAIDVALAARP